MDSWEKRCMHTQCDGEICGRVCPEEPGSFDMLSLGWAHMVWNGEGYNLCPECAAKAMEAVGLSSGGKPVRA